MKAHELLNRPERWTQGTLARGANGCPLDYAEPDAVSFCAAGALAFAYRDTNEFFKAKDKLHAVIGSRRLATWNDDPTRTFDEVRAALLKADV